MSRIQRKSRNQSFLSRLTNASANKLTVPLNYLSYVSIPLKITRHRYICQDNDFTFESTPHENRVLLFARAILRMTIIEKLYTLMLIQPVKTTRGAL